MSKFINLAREQNRVLGKSSKIKRTLESNISEGERNAPESTGRRTVKKIVKP